MIVQPDAQDCSLGRIAALGEQHADLQFHGAIAREAGLHWRTVDKWTRLSTLPERAIMAPKTTTPGGFRA